MEILSVMLEIWNEPNAKMDKAWLWNTGRETEEYSNEKFWRESKILTKMKCAINVENEKGTKWPNLKICSI